ncbi:MAG: AI-2E family transporter, partial [Thermaurantiacus sp.]
YGVALFVIAAVLGLIGLHLAQAVVLPLAFSLFVIALAAPLFRTLLGRLGHALSLILTVVVVMAVVALFVWVFSWAVGRIGGWVFANLPRVEDVYQTTRVFLEARGWELQQILPERFDARWVIDPLLALSAELRILFNFLLLVFVFVVLGLNELESTSARLKRIEAENPRVRLHDLLSGLSRDYGIYMKVRLIASAIDVAIVYVFLRIMGVEEPEAWMMLNFVLNFIPFIGPLILAVALTVFAAAQFGDLWMVILVVGGTTAINFTIGSYVEPIIAGNALKMSAVLVLFSVFLWSLVWGIAGAFLGVQISILMLAVLRLNPATGWIAELLSRGGEAAQAIEEVPPSG